MDIVVLIVKIILLVASTCGYFKFVQNRLDIRPEFCLSIVFSAIGSIVFLFGTFGILSIGSNLLLILGLALLMFSLVKNKDDSKSFINLGTIVFVVLSILLVIRIKDQQFFDADNYHHWGLIIKKLMYDSRFPDSGDPIIRFQTYVAGSTSFIWYYLRFFDYSEWGALYFQNLLMMSCGIGFFAFVSEADNKRKTIGVILGIIGTLSMFSCDKYLFNGPFDLLVDQMLASVAVAAFLILEYYHDDLKKSFWGILPLVIFEVTIKNSGLLFAVVLGCVFGYRVIKSSNTKKFKIVSIASLFLIPLVIRKIWDLRVSLVFDDAASSIHSMSIKNYQNVMDEKTPEIIREVTKLYLEKALSFDNFIVTFIIVLVILFAIFEYKRKDDKPYHILNKMLFIAVVYVVYQIGLYLMYTFSMPYYEALCMPCYFRYVMTIDQFIFGIIICTIIEIISREDKHGLKSIAAICMALALLVVYDYENLLPLFEKRETLNDTHYKLEFEERVDGYDFPQSQEISYLFYISDVDDYDGYSDVMDYRFQMAKYYFFSPNVRMLRKCELSDFNDIDDYDYLVLMYDDEEIIDFLEENSIAYDVVIELEDSING